MLPFLKSKDDGVGVAPVDVMQRKPDDGADYDMLDAVADDMLMALEKKDKKLLKSALSALVDHLQAMDEQQDKEMKG